MSVTPRVVVVGGINMDIQGRSAAVFRPGDSNPGASSMSPGGVGRNIAENLVRLGLDVELLTVLGGDTLSRELEASCDRLGIGLSAALRLPGETASQYICLLDADGSLLGAVAAMDGFDLLGPRVLAERAGLLDDAALIVVDANIPASAIGWLAERYGDRTRSGGRPALVLDTVSAAKAARAKPFLGSFAFAKPNRAEASVLAGLDIPASAAAGPAAQAGPAAATGARAVAEAGLGAVDTDGAEAKLGTTDAPLGAADPRALAGRLRSAGLREVFISLGEEGMYYEGLDPAGAERRGFVRRGFVRPPRPLPAGLEPVNVSGAGDAACAALAWGYLRGDPPEERARRALAAAMATAASMLTVSPDLAPDRLIELAKGVAHEPVP
ncbi:MAG TPA: PfkB family carbohydrate kinase [Rectinemataceae bacterium]|nr:PfkB family carbohydrate kinase [Rectinemataceae bacterium]